MVSMIDHNRERMSDVSSSLYAYAAMIGASDKPDVQTIDQNLPQLKRKPPQQYNKGEALHCGELFSRS